METIIKNYKKLREMDYVSLLEALIYMEIEGSELENDPDLESKIQNLATKWFKSDYVHLLPDEIRIELWKN